VPKDSKIVNDDIGRLAKKLYWSELGYSIILSFAGRDWGKSWWTCQAGHPVNHRSDHGIPNYKIGELITELQCVVSHW